ncbi:MAG: sigma-70 family RNA polymerase sigma factor [Clostridia bacterium]|nr:sigma-70 family RNA polymerase sigma factor [Clostridia bacterium]
MDNEREQNLIALAKSGDEGARDELLLEYGKLVRTIARSVELVSFELDYDDLFQVGNIGLLRAISSFDETQVASFKTYASHCIRNAIIDELRKKSPLVTVSTTDNQEAYNLPSSSDPEKEYIDKETVSIVLETLRSTLSAEEFEVLRFYLDGLSYQEISSKLDMEKKKVDNTLYGVKKKIKHILN